MTPILFYTEIVPFRDSYTQHSAVGLTFLQLAQKIRALGSQAFLLTNNEMADRILADDPAAALFLIRCTQAEEKRLRALYKPWDAVGVAEWVALAQGEGEAALLVADVLARVRTFFEFEAIVSWSDNGGVKTFCDRTGLRRLHFELGPTRAPFPETFYFDSQGTNALAHFRDRPEVPKAEVSSFPPDFWLASWFRKQNSTNVPGLADGALTWRCVPDALREAYDRPLCYIPLQLADDLNLHLGSGFRSPTEFLSAAIPAVQAVGYLPVVKPHPMAHSRPINLLAQAEALASLERIGGEYVVLRGEDADSGNWLLANAALVLTINSSVGFEAALFGTPVALAGEAAYDFRSFPRLGEVDLAALRDRRGDPALGRVVTRMLGEILYPSRLLRTRSFAQALLAAVEDRHLLLDEGLRQHLGPSADYNADPSAFLDEEEAQEAALPETLDWFPERKVVIEEDQVRIGTLTLPLWPKGLVGRASAHALKHREGDNPANRSWALRGYVYRNHDQTAASGLLCLAMGHVVAAYAASRPRPDLERKRLPSQRVGFEHQITLPAEMNIDALQLLPFDLAQGATLWRLENGVTQVSGS